VQAKQRALIEKKVANKESRVEELRQKIDRNSKQVNSLAGDEQLLEQCLEIFNRMIQEENEEDTDREMDLINGFIYKYHQAPQITIVLWQIYYLLQEEHSEQRAIKDLMQKI
jgi:hypothetical protein